MAWVDFRHRIALRVRWAEVDLQAVVFNGHYLTYADVCITEYWRAAGLEYPAGIHRLGSDFFVRRATVDYHLPARYDDELEVCGRVTRLGHTSLHFRVEIYRRGEPAAALAVCELVYVNVALGSSRPQPLPDSLRGMIGAFETTAPASHDHP